MLSVVDYPDRGYGGKNTYRGNCSPKLIEDLIEQYQMKNLNDFMCGSGTTEDVCSRRGIETHTALLYPICMTAYDTFDIRDSISATWRDVVASVLENKEICLGAINST